MNTKQFGLIIAIILGVSIYSLNVVAESTVRTSKGTFRCDNACSVDSQGNVEDTAGGKVWKLQEK